MNRLDTRSAQTNAFLYDYEPSNCFMDEEKVCKYNPDTGEITSMKKKRKPDYALQIDISPEIAVEIGKNAYNLLRKLCQSIDHNSVVLSTFAQVNKIQQLSTTYQLTPKQLETAIKALKDNNIVVHHQARGNKPKIVIHPEIVWYGNWSERKALINSMHPKIEGDTDRLMSLEAYEATGDTTKRNISKSLLSYAFRMQERLKKRNTTDKERFYDYEHNTLN